MNAAPPRKPVIRAYPRWRIYPDAQRAAADNRIAVKYLQNFLARGGGVIDGRHYHYASEGEIAECQFRQLDGEDFGFSLIAEGNNRQ